jgi:CspA family cold shock protein
MQKGKVKWYNETKGFGFIVSENGEEVFVHRSGLYSSFGGLQPEEEVVFETKQGEKGPYAVNVKTAN